MDIKSRILGRAKPKVVEFLSSFQTVEFDDNGSGKLVLNDAMVMPIEAALLVPYPSTPSYNDTLGVSCTVSPSGAITIGKEDFDEFLTLGGGCKTALVSVGQKYNARSVQQLLPAEVRLLTNGSAEVMQMLTDKDPDITERLTKSITEKIGKKDTQFDMGNALEAALNVELTLKHPDLLEEIEMIQQLQPATQLAVMIGADLEFVKTLYRYVPEGSSMVSELVSIVDPPPVYTPPAPDDEDSEPETVDVTVEAPLSAIEDSLMNDMVDDDLEPEEGGPVDDAIHGDYAGDQTEPLLSLA